MAREPLRWSHLKHMAQSPKKYRHVLDHGVDVTPAMRLGSLVHAMALGNPRAFALWDGGARRGKEWDAFKAQHEGVEIYTRAEWEHATACADAVKADPVAGPMVKRGMREHRIEWSHGGRRCAGTPDLNGDILSDVKVSHTVSPQWFPRHARRMGWHGQLVWYRDGIEAATGRDIQALSLIAVEPKPPHEVIVYEFEPWTIESGRKLWRSLFERLMTCEESDSWPGYAQSPLRLSLEDDGALELLVEGEEVVL